MDIKKLNEEIKTTLNEGNWDNFAGRSLPNGDKDDDDYTPVVRDIGEIVINILGTDIVYKVSEHKYSKAEQDKLFGGIFVDASDNINDLTEEISNKIYSEINKQLKEKFNRTTDYDNEPTFIEVPRHMMSHN